MRVSSAGEPEQTNCHGQNSDQLNDSRQALQIGALPRTSNVHSRSDGNHEKRDQLGCPRPEFNDPAQIVAERDRKRGHGSSAYDEKQNPAKKKGSQFSKAVSNVNVKATRLRFHGTQLAID